MKQGPLKSSEKKTAVNKKKKINLSKLTTEEFFEQDFENDANSDIYDSDETDENTGDSKY